MMRKITNSMKVVNISTKQTKENKSESRSEQIKKSLNQIQKLTLDIDNQMNRRKMKHNNDNQNATQQNHSQEDSNYNVGEDRQILNQESSSIDKTVQIALDLYFGYASASNTELVDIQFYEEYKKIKQFNKDFKEISQKLEQLRRISLCNPQTMQTNATTLSNESDVTDLMFQCLKRNLSSLDTYNIESNQKDRTMQMIRGIQMLQRIQDAIQQRLEALQDQIQFKRKIVQDLRINQSTIEDDVSILQSRNTKLRKQLQNSNHQAQQLYLNSSQDQPDEQSVDQGSMQTSYPDSEPNNQDSTEMNYQKEYLEIMTQYQIFNPLTQSLEQSFPKNKTEAMMLLNTIQSKIQNIEMQKLLKGYSQ